MNWITDHAALKPGVYLWRLNDNCEPTLGAVVAGSVLRWRSIGDESWMDAMPFGEYLPIAAILDACDELAQERKIVDVVAKRQADLERRLAAMERTQGEVTRVGYDDPPLGGPDRPDSVSGLCDAIAARNAIRGGATQFRLTAQFDQFQHFFVHWLQVGRIAATMVPTQAGG